MSNEPCDNKPCDNKPCDQDRQNREKRIQRLVKDFEDRVRKGFASDPQTLDEIERQSHELGEEVKKSYQSELVQSRGRGYVGSSLPCRCGGRSRFVSDRSRRIVTRSGVVGVSRSYYHCAHCGQGSCPLDQNLCLPSVEYSCGVAGLCSRLCAFLSFEAAAREAKELLGICLSASTLRRMTLGMGEQIAQDWSAKQALLWKDEMLLSSSVRPSQLHVSMDGVFLHVDGDWKETKLGVVYQAQAEGRVTHSDFYATLKPSGEFGRGVRTLAHVCGADRCRAVGVVADGGPWIWQEAGKHFSGKVQILDFYHASQHLWEVARAWHGEPSKAADWVCTQTERLLDDRVAEVIEAIEVWKPRQEKKCKIRRTNLAYFREHRHRMLYQQLRDQGWHIGSGVQESSCNWVVQARLKGVGRRWKSEGAEAMLNVRTAWCSSTPTDFTQVAKRAFATPLS